MTNAPPSGPQINAGQVMLDELQEHVKLLQGRAAHLAVELAKAKAELEAVRAELARARAPVRTPLPVPAPNGHGANTNGETP